MGPFALVRYFLGLYPMGPYALGAYAMYLYHLGLIPWVYHK